MQKECTCYKVYLYGRCKVCKEFEMTDLAKEVKKLIEKHPYQVKQLLENKTN